MRLTLAFIGLAAAACLIPSTVTAAEPPSAPGKPLSYFIVVTGGELLEGVYPDAHTPFITRALRPLGCQCVGSITVDDNREDIQRALRFATNRAPLVLVTGGLGPTPNDITRETLSEFTEIPLHEHPEAVAELERRFNQTRNQLRPNLLRQTLTPERGSYLKNPNGTAVGLVFDMNGGHIIALPGPPRELQPMVRNELLPFLREHFGVREFGCSLTLRFVGAGQSLIDQTIKDHVPVAPDVVVTSLFEGSRVDFTFSLAGNTEADRTKLKRLEQSIAEHLAEYIYADDGATLEEVVGRKFQKQGASLAVVEIGSGGSLAAALSGTRAGASVLTGACVAPTEATVGKLLQFSSPDPATPTLDRMKSLARAAAAKVGSQSALAISPVEPDDKGQPSVLLVLQLPSGAWESQRLPLRDSGEITRNTLTTQALDFLRRRLP
jgi:nicotinamide-nucleotide amidase